jgi:dTDP-4-dehydrorhamnose 3,5-epimerase
MSLEVNSLELKGILLFRPRKFNDARGYFIETFNARSYAEAGVDSAFVQDNQSLSRRTRTIRGLHFQRPPAAQAKLMRVLRGSTFDVMVDLRHASPSYGRWCSATLTVDGGEQLFVSRGFAHGFCTLEPNTEVALKLIASTSHRAMLGFGGTTPILRSYSRFDRRTP